MNFKTLLACALLLFFCINARSQVTIPISGKNANSSLGKLVKIERGDSISTFYFTRKADEDHAFELPENIFVETEIDQTRYYSLSKNRAIDKAYGLDYTLNFPTIDQSAKTIKIGYETVVQIDGKTIRNFRYLASGIDLQPSKAFENSQNIFSKIGFDDALDVSKQQNKKILLYFTAGWCGPCKWMEKYIFSDQKVIDTVNQNYIAIKFDVDSFEGEKLRRMYNGQGVPDFFILNSKGAILKRHQGVAKRSEFLDFMIVDENEDAKSPEKSPAKISKDYNLGLRLGTLTNTINNYPDAHSKIGFSAELLVGIDYNRRYTLRSGLGFVSKGIQGDAVNYLKLPVEFGYSIYKGSLFNLPGAVRFISAPYYALRLNNKDLGIAKTDYGIRFGLAPHIGDFNEMEFELYYELGLKDKFNNIQGFQNNSSFGINISLFL